MNNRQPYPTHVTASLTILEPFIPHLLTLPVIALSIFLTACASGSSEAPSNSPETPPSTAEVQVELDGTEIGPFENVNDFELVGSVELLIATTDIDIHLRIEDDNPDTNCYIGDELMVTSAPGDYTLRLQAAYFSESFDFYCLASGTDIFRTTFEVRAHDPQLDAYIDFYINNKIPTGDSSDPDDPYSGYRRDNYYSEIYRFLAAAEIYTTPELYGVDPEGPNFAKLKLYLINTAEAFFEPCPNYDFTGPLSLQCRSEDRDGAYYLWRSPNVEDSVRTIHAKVEWRAAGGIAQAIKALLLRNPIAPDITCSASNEPSAISDESLACRALNVRRLLFEEIWLKWNDDDWADSAGVSFLQRIPNTTIANYIAWFELIVDLFNSTQNISVSFECADCSNPIVAESRVDDLISLFYNYGEDLISFTCKLPGGGSCIWNGYDLEIPGSAEIGHVDTMIHLLTLNDQREACSSKQGACVNLTQLADSMYELTWIDSIDNVDGAEGFPKFDVFFDGYCSRASYDTNDPLNFFCTRYWLTEIGGWEPHRKLLGWVNLGRFNRDLMIALRRAADENHDGKLVEEDDGRLSTFAVFLRKAQLNQPN